MRGVQIVFYLCSIHFENAVMQPHIERIDSSDDARLTVFRTIQDRKLLSQHGLFIAEGEFLVQRLLQSSYEIKAILATENKWTRLQPFLSASTTCYVAPERVVQSIAGFPFHRGVMACGRRKSLPSLQQLWPHMPPSLLMLVCAGIYDAENLGVILRTCAAFDVQAVLLSEDTIDPFYRRVIRVSMGAVFNLPMAQSRDLHQDLQWLGEQGVELFAAVVDQNATPLQDAGVSERNAIIVGNEAQGLDAIIRGLCPNHITIPIHRSTDSLNVAVATSIILYHFKSKWLP